ncbi:MAG: hypothetical protein RLZZ507_3649 [Cyanobacteriota bacterium]|jgi:hypothetical protein
MILNLQTKQGCSHRFAIITAEVILFFPGKGVGNQL